MIIRPLHKTKGIVHTCVYMYCTCAFKWLLTVKNFKYVHVYLYVNQCMNECMHVMCVCLLDYFSIHLTGGCFIIAVYLRMAGTVLRHKVRGHISFIALSISCNKLTLYIKGKKTHTKHVQIEFSVSYFGHQKLYLMFYILILVQKLKWCMPLIFHFHFTPPLPPPPPHMSWE